MRPVRCVRSSRAGLKQRFCFCFMFSQSAAPDDPWEDKLNERNFHDFMAGVGPGVASGSYSYTQ